MTRDVIEACELDNVAFVFVSLNTTHLTQPLHVAYFGSLKELGENFSMNEKEVQENSYLLYLKINFRNY